ncbi:hypothetical protein [Acidocella sp.]|uniref:hypothetical protein n=1 Tax=Acidocella sp. TaxID=50710 RepID=UPI002615AD80|nr:hypothetical protein [Acidocella sp.]MDD2795172.1 hypothetical protein [Acidocella sp.]
MAHTGVLPPGFTQRRVLGMQSAVEHCIKRIGLNRVTEATDERMYLKAADEFDRRSSGHAADILSHFDISISGRPAPGTKPRSAKAFSITSAFLTKRSPRL